MIKPLVILFKRLVVALGRFFGFSRRIRGLQALEIYARVAEQVAAQEADQGGISPGACRFLRILQKELLGKMAITTEE